MLRALLIPFEEVLVPIARIERRLLAEVLTPLAPPPTDAEWEAHGAGREPRAALEAIAAMRGLALPPDEIRRLAALRARRFAELAAVGQLVPSGAVERVRDAARRVPLGVLSRLPREETTATLKGAGIFDRLTALSTGGYRRCHEDLNSDLLRLRKEPAHPRATLALAGSRDAVDEARASSFLVASVGRRIGGAHHHAGSLEDLDLDEVEKALL